MLSHRLIMLKPMRTGISGYARVQSEGGRTEWQLNARGVKVTAIRAFWYSGEGEVRELGKARVNPRGEAFLATEVANDRVAPERLQALLVLSDEEEPAPLLIGLCVQQSAGSLLDAKNAILALCEKLSRATRLRRVQQAEKTAEIAPEGAPRHAASAPDTASDQKARRTNEQSAMPVERPAARSDMKKQSAVAQTAGDEKPPREIFLPAIDPLPYVMAEDETPLARPTETCPLVEPDRTTTELLQAPRKAPPADRLRPLVWPGAYERLSRYFDHEMPCALFDLPGWRFVRVSRAREGTSEGDLWIGRYQTDGRVCRVAYAIRGEQPPPDGRPYRARRGMDGKTYQVLWQRV